MKIRTLYVCQNCGASSPRWLGRCPSCESWNSYVEEEASPAPPKAGPACADFFYRKEDPVALGEVASDEDHRLKVSIEEFDRVMGGGIVPGSVTLIGGDPGIGKSTLCLQIGSSLAHKGHRILYVSGEESVKQVKIRADRLGAQKGDSFYLVNQVNLGTIVEYIKTVKPQVVILDSIQVVFREDLNSSPGSVAQVRECGSLLTQLAKMDGIAFFIIGHVTKEGMLAGPRVLEHIVDTVLYFEGERYSTYRILRTTKNRFGSTNEIGVFEMTAAGLMEVSNPSEIFLSERPRRSSGSVVLPVMEGTRPFLVEIQGLVSRSAFGMVRQKAQGFDSNRLALLAAVLEKRIGLNLQDKDIFLNVVGGVKVMDPAADLAAAMAVASAFLDRVIPFDTVVLGEVGLSAEVRGVGQIASRINEAEKLGFKRCLLPKNNLNTRPGIKSKIELIGVEGVPQALEYLEKA